MGMQGEREGRDGDKVYHRLRAAILRLEMRPGAAIEEASLAEDLRVSRTPVREAIIQLIADGLVVRDGRIARVAPLDFDDLPHLLDALLTASRIVHRLAAEHRSPADLAAIEAAMLAFEAQRHGGDGLRRSELNRDFHLAISAAARNRYFQAFYETTLNAQIRLARACFSGSEEDVAAPSAPDEETARHMDETARQHRQIFQAIRDGDVEAADRLAVAHEMLSRQRLQRKLFTQDPALAGLALA